jgi:CRISPR-associated protein Csn2
MKLVHPDWNRQIVFRENRVQVVCIENARYFSRIVEDLVRQRQTGTGPFVLSDGNEIYDLSKTAELILSPFLLDFENKKIQSTILKRLQQIANDEEFHESQEIRRLILQYLNRLTDRLDVDVSTSPEIDILQVVKLANVRPLVDEDSLETRLLDYFSLLKDVLETKLIIAVNLRSYFSSESLQTFYETLLLKKTPLLLLENFTKYGKIPCEDWLIVDEDLCEI